MPNKKVTDRPSSTLDLPLVVVERDVGGAPAGKARARLARRVVIIPIAMAVLFSGAVIGMYFQPPALRQFFQITGLVPGGGTGVPIAVPAVTSDEPPTTMRDVVALGRLLPRGKLITVALPFGAGDARIAEMRVREGDRIDAGGVIAVLDNLDQLKSAVDAARATVKVREATLIQTRSAVRASLEEARASLQRAEEAAVNTDADLARAQTLFDRGIITTAALERGRLAATQAERDVERARATVSRFTETSEDLQPDVLVAERSLDAANAELARAERDLSKGYVRAPSTGTVIAVHVRAGEKPGQDGVADIGNIDQMTAELEVYQSMIGRISIGDKVIMEGDALQEPLTGTVSEIGLEVGRQTIVADEPAANTDARVVDVTVELDKDSSQRASRLTNLEVVAHITPGESR
ncbi:HlyD family efflux transporter periplasmic adaptor subunit [Oricola cellulosilytica]|nr:HlyD family efflux transporter periplasmic adaptor subunit [Oricola cellulosilytica]